ncbi:hypothetical protein M404DRAFT_30315 [Pisolithus tinctorius Marx 270]|uniref:CCHC-type domain-containing protein n=1 Tax=Pisolithus tinctorius Marx 270 TaxID=870435 RepID=A0A0C3NF20_PISTI|nr:hypothetical protein M404DRAFT_30315 [Pisolithus tinctorius Marx 270]
MALEWFEPDLLGTEDPEDWTYWMDSWKEFIIELQTTFGPHDPVADTESQLDHLQMKDNHWVNNKHQGSSSGNKSTPNPGHNAQSKPSQEKSKTSNNSNGNSSNQSSSKSTSTGQTGTNTSKLDLSKLGKDGKLTPEEGKHCKDNNLCMFCGGTRHFTDKCPKKARKAKAHAVATSEAAPASTLGSAPKAKK